MSSELRPDVAEPDLAERIDDLVPSDGYRKTPLVGLGGSAGSIEALQAFFGTMPVQSGLAFVVIIHLSPDHDSTLTELLQRCTRMPVVKVDGPLEVLAGTVYVIPPGKTLTLHDGALHVAAIPGRSGRHVVVDLFFRTLADSHGAHAAAVVLSGLDGDGSIGIKRIKERGGLTVVQDPDQALHDGMPRSSIATGMVDWVLPVEDMPARLLSYFRFEQAVLLPAHDEPAGSRQASEEPKLRDVLTFLRNRTARDFSSYKRATVLRRLGRRMQVNGVDNLGAYLNCLRTRPGECAALLQDLLISVTNFFRDGDCFAALESQIPALFEGKGPDSALRVWVVACATGEEAYSVAMLLADHARTLEAPPAIQVFATDLDASAIQAAREGVYPAAIAADLDDERLRRFFVREHRGYRVRRELREMVLFAVHDVLHDSPFSRLDLVTCRNLLIYLAREAQTQVLQTLHFSLGARGRLFIGSSESVDEGSPLFTVLDKRHRIYLRRSTVRPTLPPGPAAASTLQRALQLQQLGHEGPVLARHDRDATSILAAQPPSAPTPPDASRRTSWGELHLQLLERLAPPSVLVDDEFDIVHLSPSAGRFLQLAGGEPSRNLLRALQPELRIELRAALVQALDTGAEVALPPVQMALAGGSVPASLRVLPAHESGEILFLVLFDVQHAESVPDASVQPLQADPLARHLDAEIERLKSQLREIVEQYEATTEELKASNEELQAMNEEQRAATEELETSREELQSINEELITVNHELKGKVEQLCSANSDMQNLMDATQIATLFLDRELCIMRFTPPAAALFNLIPGDIGRPLTDMATQLQYPQLGDDARQVLARLAPVEREVGQQKGAWYLARIMPYRTIDDRIGGIVCTFIDITERKQAEEVRLWLSAVVSSTTDAIVSFALDQTILSWNKGAQRLFGYAPAEAIGQPLALLALEQEATLVSLTGEVAAGRLVDNLETQWRHQDGSLLQVAITASPIQDDDGHVMAGTAIVRDISARHAAAEALRQSEERLRLIVESAVEYAIFSTDLERRVTSWNSGAERLLGFTEDEILGRSADILFTEEDRATGAPEQEARTACAEGRASDERTHLRKDGSRFPGSGVMMLMRDAGGTSIGLVKILRDLTQQPPRAH